LLAIGHEFFFLEMRAGRLFDRCEGPTAADQMGGWGGRETCIYTCTRKGNQPIHCTEGGEKRKVARMGSAAKKGFTSCGAGDEGDAPQHGEGIARWGEGKQKDARGRVAFIPTVKRISRLFLLGVKTVGKSPSQNTSP